MRPGLRPTLIVGLVGAGAVALAAGRDLATLTSGPDPAVPVPESAGSSPAAQALALVVLACWGVVLVSRGIFRRAIAVLALLMSLGLLAVLVAGAWSFPDALQATYLDLGAESEARLSVWYVLAVVGALASVAATAGAVLDTPRWPEMGQRRIRWTTPEEAARLVEEPELAALLRKLGPAGLAPLAARSDRLDGIASSCGPVAPWAGPNALRLP